MRGSFGIHLCRFAAMIACAAAAPACFGQPYAQTVLGRPALSTALLIPFDEISGTVARDAVGPPTNGTYVGSPMLGVSGDDYGTAVGGGGLGRAFRAANGQYCLVPSDKIAPAVASDWTLNMWVRYNGAPGVPPTSSTRVWFGSDSGGSGASNTLRVAMQGRANGFITPDHMSFFVSSAAGVAASCELLTYGIQFDGLWHMVSITHQSAQNGTLCIWLDGAPGTDTTNVDVALPTSLGSLGIGAYVSGGVATSSCPFDMANLSFHTRALSAAELFSLGEIYNGRSGALVYHPEVATAILGLAGRQRAGLVMLGDSNVLRSFSPPEGTGGDQGYVLTTATWIKGTTGSALAAMMVGANAPSNGSVPYLGVYTQAVASPSSQPPQHILDRHLAQWDTDGNPNPEPYGFEPDARWRADGVHQADSTGAGTSIDPTDANWPFAPGAALRVTYDYATFVNNGSYSGAGCIFPNVLTFGGMVGGSLVPTKTGQNGWGSGSIDCGPLSQRTAFRLQTAQNDAVGPFAMGYLHLEDLGRAQGFDLSVLWAYGGQSAYTVCQALANTQKTPLSKLKTYFQRLSSPLAKLGETPRVAVQILEGQNDLSIENSGPVSSYVYTPGTEIFASSGNAGASSREGYKNDLLTIINRLKDGWMAAGYSASDFYVILGPYHQISPAPGNWRMELGYGRAEREIADSMSNVMVLDGPKIVGYDAMSAAGGYSADGGGAAHLSRAGYVLLGSATGNDALGPLIPIGACCSGTHCQVSNSAMCAGSFQGAGTACSDPGSPTTCCPANFNGENGVDVQDIFGFLTAWFAGDPRADFDGINGIGVEDLFAFLSAWFAGCD